jgi:hypothetical protein
LHKTSQWLHATAREVTFFFSSFSKVDAARVASLSFFSSDEFHCQANNKVSKPIQGTFVAIQGTFREHSSPFREHSAQFREHSAPFREHSAPFRKQSAPFREQSANSGNIQRYSGNIECP